jgi:molybdopterin-guanine dinucleotide biosynthesis protein A
MHESANLTGLLLAGGRGARMGADKAALAYAGEPQVLRGHRVLAEVCTRVLVSVRRDQARNELFAAFELVVDRHADAGPAAGLLAAWDAVPGAALLVLAVDLPLVDAAVLERLIAARDPQALATAFVHADGTIEPLCTIWEPTAEDKLRAGARQPTLSLRKVLEGDRTRRVSLQDTACLRSVNTPKEYAAVSSFFTAT